MRNNKSPKPNALIASCVEQRKHNPHIGEAATMCGHLFISHFHTVSTWEGPHPVMVWGSDLQKLRNYACLQSHEVELQIQALRHVVCGHVFSEYIS